MSRGSDKVRIGELNALADRLEREKQALASERDEAVRRAAVLEGTIRDCLADGLTRTMIVTMPQMYLDEWRRKLSAALAGATDLARHDEEVRAQERAGVVRALLAEGMFDILDGGAWKRTPQTIAVSVMDVIRTSVQVAGDTRKGALDACDHVIAALTEAQRRARMSERDGFTARIGDCERIRARIANMGVKAGG